ncbi:DUF2553 family protein [Evansella clarkii]|jgi:hypothetical protein|uniref:DUF2553 family protein n=1 Tax=Evansella clarkii TaxID=79879 RepID=UPI0009986A30|nr:DUF2553 family protein [Evansella clarkii]
MADNEQYFNTSAENGQTVTRHIVDDIRRNRAKSREEITQQVTRQNEKDGATGLYLGGQKIGHMPGGDQQHLFEMAEGFEFDKDKIYKKKTDAAAAKNPDQPQAYVEGCDMGWC